MKQTVLPSATRASSTGFGLAVTCLLVFASSFIWMRPEIGGLFVHPYVLGLVCLTPAALSVLHKFPTRLLQVAGFLFVWITASLVLDGSIVSELVKIATAGLTVIVTALSIKTERDFQLSAAAIIVAVIIITLAGYAGMTEDSLGSPDGVKFMGELGSKNTFSLYSLPAILLGGYVVSTRQLSIPMRAFFIVSSLGLCTAVFTTGNRSGWVSVAVIGVMLAAVRFSLRVGVYVTLACVGIYLLMTQTPAHLMIDHKIDQTRDGYSSDTLRQELVKKAFVIATEHPVFGDGPSVLKYDLARRVPVDRDIIDTHNVFAYLAGGFGFPALAAFIWLGLVLFFLPRGTGTQRSAHDLIRMFVVLWAVRGMFTREILYSPAMCIGLGLAIGLYIQALLPAANVAIRRSGPLAVPQLRRAGSTPT